MNHKIFSSRYQKIMKFVIKYLILVFIFFFSKVSFSQKTSEKLKREQEKLEKSISVTKSLLRKTKKNSQATISELRVLENQLKHREELLSNFEDQIKDAEIQIEEKTQQIDDLEKKLKLLVFQYKHLLIYAYKHRSKSGQWMYIFSAKSYNEALKRKKYLEKVAELQRKQKRLIEQHQILISKEKTEIESEKKEKEIIADEKRKEKENLEIDKRTKETNLSKLKKEETRLAAEMKLSENKKIILKQRIREAINAEIAADEARRKAREEKERKKQEKERLAKNNTSTSTSNTTKSISKTTTIPEDEPEETVKRPLTITETKEVALNQSFESNRGRLPWPVSSGTITEGYGKNPHPKIKNLYTNNNGIDISTNRGSSVRAVFEGEVTSVLSIPGAGKVVIIKHGNYRTVYSNLQDVNVGVGSRVKTKQSIGSLLPDDDDVLSVSHFEIHQVSNGQINRMNPTNWIAR
jgi:septal ring factor EnvC (AmiA/AmiB activator)